MDDDDEFGMQDDEDDFFADHVDNDDYVGLLKQQDEEEKYLLGMKTGLTSEMASKLARNSDVKVFESTAFFQEAVNG
jgi:hypothetical protein